MIMWRYGIVVGVFLCLGYLSVQGEQRRDRADPLDMFFDDFESGLNPLWIQSGDCSWEVSDGVVQSSTTGYDIGCALAILDSTWTDYVFEFDVLGDAGVEKAVVFRFDGVQGYVFSIRSDWITGDEVYLHVTGNYYAQIVNFPSQNGTWYHVRITCRGNYILIQIDGTTVIDYVDAENSCPAGGIALSNWSGSAGVCSVSFDNVSVTRISSECGDSNGDGVVSVTDAVHLVSFIFANGTPPYPISAGDVNSDGRINITDAVYLINYVFGGGPGPCGL